MAVKVITEYNAEEWNKLAPNPLVSWEWGEARKKMDIDVVRLGEFEGDKLINVYQMTYHKLPHTNMTIGYMPRTGIPSDAVLEKIKEESKSRKTVFVKIEPYVLVKDAKGPAWDAFQKCTKYSVHPLFPKWTQFLDLKQSEEDLMKNMKSKWRYNIKLADRKGVTIKEMTTEEGFDIFAKLYFETTDRQKYAGHNHEYHKIVFDTLKDTQSHILIAFNGDKPLSAYHLFLFNKTLYYPYGGSSTQDRNLMASNLLMWTAIKLGKKHGAENFDMWGSLPPDFDRSSGGRAGFSRFKEGFGTTFEEFVGSYDYVLNPVIYRVYNVADVIRKKFFL